MLRCALVTTDMMIMCEQTTTREEQHHRTTLSLYPATPCITHHHHTSSSSSHIIITHHHHTSHTIITHHHHTSSSSHRIRRLQLCCMVSHLVWVPLELLPYSMYPSHSRCCSRPCMHRGMGHFALGIWVFQCVTCVCFSVMCVFYVRVFE